MIEVRRHARAGVYSDALRGLIGRNTLDTYPRGGAVTDEMMRAGVALISEWVANVNALSSPHWGLWVAHDGETPVGFYLIVPPHDTLTGKCGDPPTVQLVANEGGPAAFAALMDHIAATVRAAGYRSWAALNGTDASDAAWGRKFSHGGKAGRPRHIGTLVEFHLEEL